MWVRGNTPVVVYVNPGGAERRLAETGGEAERRLPSLGGAGPTRCEVRSLVESRRSFSSLQIAYPNIEYINYEYGRPLLVRMVYREEKKNYFFLIDMNRIIDDSSYQERPEIL